MGFINFFCNIPRSISKLTFYELLIQFTPIASLKYHKNISFVEYFAEEDQKKSLKKINGIVLYGRVIAGMEVEEKVKLRLKIIRNECLENIKRLFFWLSKKEIESYFKNIYSKFGSCKILVKKETIIEFRRKKDAEKALKEEIRIFGREYKLEKYNSS